MAIRTQTGRTHIVVKHELADAVEALRAEWSEVFSWMRGGIKRPDVLRVLMAFWNDHRAGVPHRAAGSTGIPNGVNPPVKVAATLDYVRVVLGNDSKRGSGMRPKFSPAEQLVRAEWRRERINDRRRDQRAEIREWRKQQGLWGGSNAAHARRKLHAQAATARAHDEDRQRPTTATDRAIRDLCMKLFGHHPARTTAEWKALRSEWKALLACDEAKDEKFGDERTFSDIRI